MICGSCNKDKTDLSELVRTIDNEKGVYECVDCHVFMHGGYIYPSAFPLRTKPTDKQISKIRSLLKWALG